MTFREESSRRTFIKGAALVGVGGAFVAYPAGVRAGVRVRP